MFADGAGSAHYQKRPGRRLAIVAELPAVSRTWVILTTKRHSRETSAHAWLRVLITLTGGFYRKRSSLRRRLPLKQDLCLPV